MLSKLACGCKHNDTHWLERCAVCQALDDQVSARWANDKANPPEFTMHRINRVIQQETPICPKTLPVLTNGSDSSTLSESSEQTDYSQMLKFL